MWPGRKKFFVGLRKDRPPCWKSARWQHRPHTRLDRQRTLQVLLLKLHPCCRYVQSLFGKNNLSGDTAACFVLVSCKPSRFHYSKMYSRVCESLLFPSPFFTLWRRSLSLLLLFSSKPLLRCFVFPLSDHLARAHPQTGRFAVLIHGSTFSENSS